jgi:hypothetical protein
MLSFLQINLQSHYIIHSNLFGFFAIACGISFQLENTHCVSDQAFPWTKVAWLQNGSSLWDFEVLNFNTFLSEIIFYSSTSFFANKFANTTTQSI